ncbi:hypothetical protein F6X54_20215 [Micromonospora aurantiaca]|uniref:SAF domain-containing protein n=1 Tax=Micromonospora aurantiaca (nom. illeg.) TaxID=47850 RepID=A0ABQ6UDC1_9ACTN|nr:SAF domain-containing protein [Micromonospora aurantiaca]KAB1109123.1 hypothetical protein F6X54_20215 [Micromonospora aurantiaca]
MTAVAESRRFAPARPILDGAAQPKRRWSLLVGGLLLVLLCAGIFAVVQLGGDAREQVLVVARPVAAGQVITAEDLRTARVVPDAGVSLVRAEQRQQVVGRSAAVPLAEGTLLAEAQLGPARWPDQGRAVVAAAFKPGRVPAGLAAGNHALVVTVAKEDSAGPADLPAARASIPAMVVDVAAGVDGSGTTVVSLLLGRDDATKLAGAGSELSLVLVGG